MQSKYRGAGSAASYVIEHLGGDGNGTHVRVTAREGQWPDAGLSLEVIGEWELCELADTLREASRLHGWNNAVNMKHPWIHPERGSPERGVVDELLRLSNTANPPNKAAQAGPPQNTTDKRKHIERIRLLLSGPLFEPSTYKGRDGEEKTWDDKEFFESMLKRDGKWSEAQEKLLLKRFEIYEKHGHKLRPKAPPPAPVSPTAPLLADDLPF